MSLLTSHPRHAPRPSPHRFKRSPLQGTVAALALCVISMGLACAIRSEAATIAQGESAAPLPRSEATTSQSEPAAPASLNEAAATPAPSNEAAAPLPRNEAVAPDNAATLPRSESAHPKGSPIRPLAQQHVVVREEFPAQTAALYNPSIVVLPDGRLVASYRVSGKHTQKPTLEHIVTSDDGGKTWQPRHTFAIGQSRLFLAGNSIYSIGSGRQLRIIRSEDRGETWSEPSVLAEGHWHQSATNFIHANGKVYLALEKRVRQDIDAWAVGDFAPILMRGPAEADLTRPENWTFASELLFADIIPGYRDNDPQVDYFGVPFYTSEYPTRSMITRRPQIPRSYAPMGWLETNVARITDPAHYWFDPSGRTFHLLMRAHTGGTGYAMLAKVVEQDDGSLLTTLEKVPSGKTQLFLPLPGGQMRFHITHDEQTGLYWLLSSQATDSMTRAELLPEDRYSLPNNERHRMVLHFSKNLVDWNFAGLVAAGNSAKEARHYASMAIDGDDLVILSRSGNEHARNAHDGNLITFHRVENFRNLVY